MNKGNIKRGETWNQELGRERSDSLQPLWGKYFGLGSGSIAMFRALLKLFLSHFPSWELFGRSLEHRDMDPQFLRHCGLVLSRGRRHIVQQMEKNQEERSLLAEQREQEKEHLLEYMEQLQEEDLRVTGLYRYANFYQHQQQKLTKIGGYRVWTNFLRYMPISQHHHHQLFIAILNIYLPCCGSRLYLPP